MVLVFVASLVIASAGPAAPSASQAADTLLDTRPFSLVGPHTGTPSGSHLFLAEGASIAFIEPMRPIPNGSGGTAVPSTAAELEQNFVSPIKRQRIGERCPGAVDLLLDPGFDPASSLTVGNPNYANLLIIAAGESGLWVMDADPDPSDARVARVDDAIGGNVSQQLNERYCNSLALMTLEGMSYVVATFATADFSEIRFYRLSDLRSVLAASSASETGQEIIALRRYVVRRHPRALMRSPQHQYKSYTMDVVVDQEDPASSDADVYVAMLADGIVRLRVTRNWLESLPGGTRQLRWGPVFGTGSHYASLPDPGVAKLYNNFEWINEEGATPVVERSDPPIFVSLAVDRAGAEARLYAAVEPLGWVQFDLGDNWNYMTKIRHHEGVAANLNTPGYTNAGAWLEDFVIQDPLPPQGPTAKPRKSFDYARDIEVVEGPGERYVVYTSQSTPFMVDPPVQVEGFAYEDRFQYGGVTHNFPTYGASGPKTRVYRVSDLPYSAAGNQGPSLSTRLTVDVGGERLFVPSSQQNILGTLEGQGAVPRLEFLATGGIGGLTASSTGDTDSVNRLGYVSLRLNAPGNPDPILAWRRKENNFGWRLFNLIPSLQDSDVLITAITDGVTREGVPYLATDPVTGERTLEADRDASLTSGSDSRFAGGTTIGRNVQWIESFPGPGGLFSLQHCMTSTGRIQGGPEVHLIAVQNIAQNPSTLERVFTESRFGIQSVLDRWKISSRVLYVTSHIDTRYDQYVKQNYPNVFDGDTSESAFDPSFAFFTALSTPDGISFGLRNRLMDLLPSTPLAAADAMLPPQETDRILRFQLDTHSEFDSFPIGSETDARTAASWWLQLQSQQPYRARVQTFEPRMVRVQGPTGTDFSGWVLAVPCGVSALGTQELPNLDLVTVGRYRTLTQFFNGVNPGWFPQAGTPDGDSVNHGVVKLWDFTDPQAALDNADPDLRVPNTGPAGQTDIPSAYLPIGSEMTPDTTDLARSSQAWHLESLEVRIEGEDRTFLFVGDFIGGVHIYEVSNALKGPGLNAPVLRDSWYPPRSTFDNMTNNIRGLAIDPGGDKVRLYVAVQRHGVEVMEVDFASGNPVLTSEGTLEGGTEPLTLVLDPRPNGERLLYVTDHRRGLSVYTSN